MRTLVCLNWLLHQLYHYFSAWLSLLQGCQFNCNSWLLRRGYHESVSEEPPYCHHLLHGWENKTKIIVEDDVWIGQGALILGGAILHQGCVIGAGAVVSGEVPPYAIYANHTVLKYRFNDEVCKKLERIDYSKIDQSIVDKLEKWHKIEINESNVDELMKVVPLKCLDV